MKTPLNLVWIEGHFCATSLRSGVGRVCLLSAGGSLVGSTTRGYYFVRPRWGRFAEAYPQFLIV